MAFELSTADIESLLLGGCFFGSGGGGTLTSARSLASHFKRGDYYPSDRVQVVSVDEVDAGDTVMVAYLGSPAAINGATYPEGPVEAVRQIQERLAASGRRLAYVVPPESGALGFLVACLVAAKLELAVIDADGAGRAVPSLPQLTYAADGVNPRPTFLVSQSGLCVELDVKPRGDANGCFSHQQDVSAIIDQMLRPIVAESDFGQFGGLAIWIMEPSRLQSALPIRGTLTRALTLGRALQSGNIENAGQLLDFLSARFKLPARSIFGPARFISAELDTSTGFDLGKVRLQAGDKICTVLYQNESLLTWVNDQPQPVCMAPDSIAYFVEGEGQSVFSNGDLVLADGSLNPALLNRTVTLVGILAASELQQGLILSSFMNLLVSMGYLGPYVPLNTSGNQ